MKWSIFISMEDLNLNCKKKMKTKEKIDVYEITFRDEFPATSLEDCYDDLLDYLRECVENQDVTAFNFVNLTKLKVR